MKNGSNLAKAIESSHNHPQKEQIMQDNNILCNNERKSSQIFNANSLDLRKMSQNQEPQIYNNMLPGKKLKAIRIYSEKVSKEKDGIILDSKQYQNRSQQSSIKQQNTFALQPSNYEISPLTQINQCSPISENMPHDTFKFTSNNLKKNKQNTQNESSLDKIILQLNTGAGTFMSQQNKKPNFCKQYPDYQSSCQMQKNDNVREEQQFEENYKLHSIQNSDDLHNRKSCKIEGHIRQESINKINLIQQNKQQSLYQNQINTYDFKNIELSNQDENRIRITNILKNQNSCSSNDEIILNPQNNSEQQNLINSQMTQQFIKQSINQLYSSQKNSINFQQVQQKSIQSNISNQYISQHNEAFQESIQQKYQQCHKFPLNNFESDNIKNEHDINNTYLKVANYDQINKGKDLDTLAEGTQKKRSISLQKNPYKNEQYQINHQYQNILQIEDKKQIHISNDQQRNNMKSSTLNIQKQIQSPNIIQNFQNNLLQSVNQSKFMVEDDKKIKDYDKQEINNLHINQKQLRQIIVNNNHKQKGSSTQKQRDTEIYEKSIGYNIKQLGNTNIDKENNKAWLNDNKQQRNNDKYYKINQKVQEENETNQNLNKIDIQKKNIKVQLNPISRQERAKSAQDTLLKPFNEETYIVNLDEQKQQILHVRKIRRKPVGESVALSNQINISQDYYNTPVLNLAKKSVCQSENIDKHSLQSIIYSQPLNKFSSSLTKKQNEYKNIIKNDQFENKQLDFDQAGQSCIQQLKQDEKNKADEENCFQIQQVESGVKYIESKESTTSASKILKKDKNGSIKLIKLQQYYDLKYESKFGQFWDLNKRRTSKQFDSIKNKYLNKRLNMSLNDPNYNNSIIQQPNQQTSINTFNSISQSGAYQQNQMDDSKSVLKILFEKSKRDQESQNLLTNPDPWEQDQLSDSSF